MSSETQQPDRSHLKAALAQAHQALHVSNPNPRVGCVLVDMQGQTIGVGHTRQAGGPHAEVVALREAKANNHPTQGATAYVTLEPCSHHGRTPPCCDALIAAGVSRVVAATLDPNPLVAGKGVDRLRAAGIEVEVLPAASAEAVEACELNIGFFSRMVRGTPWVRLKTAASLDGTTALSNGSSQWITGEAARTDGHAWRARACAVLTGIGTVRQDDPMLDVRLVEVPRQPHLVIVDSRLETPESAKLFGATKARKILIYCAAEDATRRTALEAKGATVIHMPGTQAGTEHKVDLAGMMVDLGKREVNELHVEAGHKLHGSLLREGLVDELLTYLAPKLLGPGLGMAATPPLSSLQDATDLQFKSVDMLGGDLRIVARLAGRDTFLAPELPVG